MGRRRSFKYLASVSDLKELDVNVLAGVVYHENLPVTNSVYYKGMRYKLRCIIWWAATGELHENHRVKRIINSDGEGIDNLFVPEIYNMEEAKRAKLELQHKQRSQENVRIVKVEKKKRVMELTPPLPELSDEEMVAWCDELYYKHQNTHHKTLLRLTNKVIKNPHLYYQQALEVIDDILTSRP